ncbi:MAG: HDOD domain-containing protein [Planctomycetota bacterium]
MSPAPDASNTSSQGNPHNVDLIQRDAHLAEADRALIAQIGKKVDSGKLELPQLPSTSSAVIAMSNDPKAEIGDIVELIRSDPTLSTDLLKTANSAAYSGQAQIETIRDAVARLGMRRLRSLIFAASMRSVMKGPKVIMDYASELWRQSNSVAAISRNIASMVGLDGEKTFLVGLLHDVGKIPVLRMLCDEARQRGDMDPMIVGTAFHRFHEKAGQAMAEAWNLSDELCAVAGCHHDFESNEGFAQTAALVNLAHKLDLYLSAGDSASFRDPGLYDELSFLGLDKQQVAKLFDKAEDTYFEMHPAQREAA